MNNLDAENDALKLQLQPGTNSSIDLAKNSNTPSNAARFGYKSRPLVKPRLEKDYSKDILSKFWRARAQKFFYSLHLLLLDVRVNVGEAFSRRLARHDRSEGARDNCPNSGAREVGRLGAFQLVVRS